MINKIFISYRREDTSGYALAIYNELIKYFDKNQVFFDINSIQSGENFKNVIKQSISQSKLFIAVIGKNWFYKSNENDINTNENEDFVLYEVSEALKQNKIVIPVVIDQKNIPEKDSLPISIKEISNKNCFVINPMSSTIDIENLLSKIKMNVEKEIIVYDVDNFYKKLENSIKIVFSNFKNSIKSIKNSPEKSLSNIASRSNSNGMFNISNMLILCIAVNTLLSCILWYYYMEFSPLKTAFDSCFAIKQNNITDHFLYKSIFLLPLIYFSLSALLSAFFIIPQYFYITEVKEKSIKLNFKDSHLWAFYYTTMFSVILELIIFLCILAIIYFCNYSKAQFYLSIIFTYIPFIFTIVICTFILIITIYSTGYNIVYGSGIAVWSLAFFFIFPLFYIYQIRVVLIFIVDTIAYFFGIIYYFIIFIPYNLLKLLNVAKK